MKNDNIRDNALLKTSHLMILIAYSLLSVALIAESLLMGWETWMVYIIGISVLGCWFMHVQNVLTPYQRLWVYSILMMVISAFYGIHLTSTYDLVGVISVCIGLFTLTGVTALIYLWQVTYYLILAYDLVLMWSQDYPFDSLVISRTMLHVFLIVLVGWISRIIIRRWAEILYRSKDETEILQGATTRLNDFLANVSHEIRTPINAVIGLTDVCIEKVDNQDVQEDLISVKDAGKRVAEQISDILDYSEIDMKKLAVNVEQYMLSSVLNDVVTEMAYIKPKHLELIVDVDAACPAMMVTDVPKLKKILWHLISNGLKYTKEGGVYVHIYSVTREYGVNLCIEVEDTGVGMSPEEREHIYEHFYQGNSGRTRSTSGLGLGMAIVSGFVKVLGGFIIIDSELGKGTKVKVSIPQDVIDPSKCMSLKTKDDISVGAFLHFDKFVNLQVREFYNLMVKHIVQGLGVVMRWVETADKLRELTDNMELTHLFVGEEEYMENSEFIESLSKRMVVAVIANPNFCQVPWSKIRILPKPFYCFPVATLLNQDPSLEENRVGRLMCNGVKALVVDDEPMNHMVANGIFRRYGMEVFTANSGKESIAMCETDDYDIIFMDHMMPEMDGIEAMKRIRTVLTRRHKDVPIIALTANAVSTAKKMFLREGFNGFISKPIELSELERVLRKVMPKELCTDVFETEEEAYERTASKKTSAQSESNREATTSQEIMSEGVPEPDKTLSPLEQVAALGIDTKTGLYYCQKDEEFYRKLLLQYAGDAPKKQQDAEKFFAGNDYPNYEIVVHALKSTSKMIGAGKLSELALALENAAKAEDGEFIRTHHEAAMTEYKRLVDGIIKAYEEPAQAQKTEEFGNAEDSESNGEDEVMEFAPDDEPGNDSGGGNDEALEFLPEED
ncbi:MAG: response regulator [Lachnospiraceae bacterium]|nr:response regulator [Lachnospiraceae bacterium]